MKSGFIATYTVLIVSAVVISSALAVTFLSIGSGQGAVATGAGKSTLAFVEGCVEDSLEKSRLDPTYGDPVGTPFIVTFPEGNCSVTINSKEGTVWTMTVERAAP